jgi:hypothetical protein
MLHKLVDNGNELWTNDPEKRSIIYEKYKQYQVPVCVLSSNQYLLFVILIFRKKKLIGLVYYLMKH